MAENENKDQPQPGRASVADRDMAPPATSRRTRAAEDQDKPEQPPKPGEVVRVDGGIDDKDILGGNIAETINIPVETAPKDRTHQMDLLLRAARAKMTLKLQTVTGRPLAEWGIVGKGDEVRGHFILVDLDTLEKVEVVDYWKIDEDRILANAQQLPKILMRGDALEKL